MVVVAAKKRTECALLLLLLVSLFPPITYAFHHQFLGVVPKATTSLDASSSNIQNNDIVRADSSPRYLRWHKNPTNQRFELQTACTVFQNETKRIELHAIVHVGDPLYFEYFNSQEFNANKDAVLYELLLDRFLLEDSDVIRHPNRVRRQRVRSMSIQASPSEQAAAVQYGWACQADCMDFGQQHWIHADFTRQELLEKLDHDRDSRKPLWLLESSVKSTPLFEAATALFVGPPIYVQQTNVNTNRRLFTNLFLPGNAFALWVRLLLWGTVPSPEISVLLLDWSSTWFLASDTPTPSSVTRILGPLFHAISAGRLDQVRKLLFGHVIMVGHAVSATTVLADNSSIIIAKRNDRALEVLDESMQNRDATDVAILYGCNHCPDLHAKLERQFGYTGLEKTWRTVWSIGQRDSKLGVAPISLVPAILIPTYLLIGGEDWISTLQSIAIEMDGGGYVTAGGLALFYLFRHVLLYVGLSKLLFEFGDS